MRKYAEVRIRAASPPAPSSNYLLACRHFIASSEASSHALRVQRRRRPVQLRQQHCRPARQRVGAQRAGRRLAQRQRRVQQRAALCLGQRAVLQLQIALDNVVVGGGSQT
jgi:hypothetical protein